MKQCLSVLRRTTARESQEHEEEEEEEETEGALELLSELCENLDNARGEEHGDTGRSEQRW